MLVADRTIYALKQCSLVKICSRTVVVSSIYALMNVEFAKFVQATTPPEQVAVVQLCKKKKVLVEDRRIYGLRKLTLADLCDYHTCVESVGNEYGRTRRSWSRKELLMLSQIRTLANLCFYPYSLFRIKHEGTRRSVEKESPYAL